MSKKLVSRGSNVSVPKRPTKRVRISNPEVDLVVYELEDRTSDEKWYSPLDYRVFNESIRRKCAQHRQNRDCTDCFSRLYEIANSSKVHEDDEQRDDERHTLATDSKGNANSRMDHWNSTRHKNRVMAEKQLSASAYAQQAMEEWARQHSRGLERYYSQLHAFRQVRHIHKTKHAVVIEQARQSLLKVKDSERLARQASLASCPARSFATFVGLADTWAVLHENDLPSERLHEPVVIKDRLG